MLEIKKVLKLSRLDYYETHLSLMNCILPKKLTPMEIKVIATFMTLDGEIVEYRFGPTARKLIMSSLDLSAGGLSNYMTSLMRKGFIGKKGDSLVLWPLLVPEEKEQLYTLKLIKENEQQKVDNNIHT